MANSWLFYAGQVLQNKQIATSKGTMTDQQSAEKFCYFKNGLIAQKSSKTIIVSVCIYIIYIYIIYIYIYIFKKISN